MTWLDHFACALVDQAAEGSGPTVARVRTSPMDEVALADLVGRCRE